MPSYILVAVSLVLMALASPILRGQSLPPLGAVWHYDMLPGICICDGYFRHEAVNDTMWEGHLSRKILVTRHYSPTIILPSEDRYIFERNDSVFLWDTEYPAWCLLYDFTVDAGESWIYHVGPSSTVSYLADSIDTVLISGVPLKRIFFSTTATYVFAANGIIIQRMGSLYGYQFPYPEWFDFDIPEGLRCYEDSTIGLYETPISYGCDSISFLTPSVAPDLERVLDFFYDGSVTMRVTVQLARADLQILNAAGQRVFQKNVEDGEAIQLNMMARGVYWVRLEDTAGHQMMRRLPLL